MMISNSQDPPSCWPGSLSTHSPPIFITKDFPFLGQAVNKQKAAGCLSETLTEGKAVNSPDPKEVFPEM